MPGAPVRVAAVPPCGCVVELRGLGRGDLNGRRGISLGQSEELREKCRVGVLLDDGSELSVPAGRAFAAVAFEERPGKGIGAVAQLPTRAGGLLLREAPALCGRFGDKPDRRQLRSLPPDIQRAIWGLSDVYTCGREEEKTLEGIVATNALPRGAGSEQAVLCVLASRCNHSCSPNAEYLWDAEAGREDVRAVRDIAPGEEVCVNYFGDLVQQPRSVRQAHLRDGWHFDCCCLHCLAADPASDARRGKLVKLGEQILLCRERPEEGLRMAEEMLELMQLEGISGPRTAAQVCNDGFELAVLMGDQTEVQLWAHMSYEAHRQGWGEAHPMTRRMKHYVQQPPSLSTPSSVAPEMPGAKEAIAGHSSLAPASITRSSQPEEWLASMD